MKTENLNDSSPNSTAAIRMIYCTTESVEQATQIGRTLVEEGHIACANILPQMTSIYRWQDQIETGQEAVLLLKTTEQATSSVINRVQELHSYDCPAILALPVTAGASDYLRWIQESVT